MMKILVAFHKPYVHATDSAFLNLHVGKKTSHHALAFPGDDTGDNISERNENFCELTGLYWLWKNYPLPEVIGLSHYRRYFNCAPSLRDRFQKQREVKSGQMNFDGLAHDHHTKIPALMTMADIILPKSTNLHESIKDHYIHSHIKEDWNVLERLLQEMAPDYSLDFFSTQTRLHEFNMFIAPRSVFEHYMAWVFPIVFELHRRLERNEHAYQKRAIGFMSERLLNLYVYTRNLKVKELPVFFLKD